MTAAPSAESLPCFILASGSPRRLELLGELGFEPTVRPVDIDESPGVGEAPADYVARLAREKAQAQALPGEIVLGADTIVALDRSLLGKPRDDADARRMLRELSGRAHQVLTGVAVCVPDRNLLEVEAVTTEVFFGQLSPDLIDWYVSTGEPADKAGAYAIQGRAAIFIERIEGNYSNVVGLPLPTATRLLRRAGLELAAGPPRASSDSEG